MALKQSIRRRSSAICKAFEVGMWNWIQQNSGALSAAASFLTLFVWALYFQLLYNNYRRLRRPKILINRGAGQTIKSKCLVANMSAEAVYVEAVMISVDSGRSDDEPVVCSLSDLDTTHSADGDPRPQWFQGPLKSGEMLDLGSYEDVVGRALKENGAGDGDRGMLADVTSVTITIIASYMSEDGAIGANRTFDLEHTGGGKILMHPHTFSADQLRSRGERRRLRKYLTRELRDERSSVR